jgi:hypothetical protein
MSIANLPRPPAKESPRFDDWIHRLWKSYIAELFTAPDVGAATGTSLLVTGKIGYTTGAGGTQTQGTSKSTTVVLNHPCGQITMHNATLNAATIVSFTLTNSAIGLGDVLILNHISGGTIGAYTFNAQAAAGSATINVRNATAGNLGEAIVIGFALIKGVTS